VVRLMEEIGAAAWERLGVRLQREVEVVGESAP
jgi:UDP-N-acetylenolpyruvoylglucosamine reductase